MPVGKVSNYESRRLWHRKRSCHSFCQKGGNNPAYMWHGNFNYNCMSMISQIKHLYGYSKEYSETQLVLHKLKIVDKTARILSFSTMLVMMIMTGLFCIGFGSLGLTLKLSDWLGNYYGFFIVGGFHLFVFLIVYGMRKKWIKKPVSDLVIQNLLK